jgi:hypothetical protein
MPRSQDAPVTSTLWEGAAPYPTSTTSSYGTRNKRYVYSHTNPPRIAPPPRNPERPPIPKSTALQQGSGMGFVLSYTAVLLHFNLQGTKELLEGQPRS